MSYTCECGKVYDGYAQCFPCPAYQEKLDTVIEEGTPERISEGIPELIEGQSILKKNKEVITDINILKENRFTIIGLCMDLNMNSPKNKHSSYTSSR